MIFAPAQGQLAPQQESFHPRPANTAPYRPFCAILSTRRCKNFEFSERTSPFAPIWTHLEHVSY